MIGDGYYPRCGHGVNLELIRQDTGGGGVQYRLYCKVCDAKGQAIPHSMLTDEQKINARGVVRHAPDPEPYAVLYLLPGAPCEIVVAAHRALSKVLHPDAGGSTQAMQRINRAKDQIVGSSQAQK